MLSSCPPTPALYREACTLDSDPKNPSKNTLPSLKPINSEYRLSNRKLRQLSPIESKPTTNESLTVDNVPDGFINHAYSTESIYNQLPATDSASAVLTTTDSTAPPIFAATDSNPSAPSSTTTTASSSPTPQRTVSENFRQMCSVICELMKNPRYVCIIIANLAEGILIKGKSCIYFLYLL